MDMCCWQKGWGPWGTECGLKKLPEPREWEEKAWQEAKRQRELRDDFRSIFIPQSCVGHSFFTLFRWVFPHSFSFHLYTETFLSVLYQLSVYLSIYQSLSSIYLSNLHVKNLTCVSSNVLGCLWPQQHKTKLCNPRRFKNLSWKTTLLEIDSCDLITHSFIHLSKAYLFNGIDKIHAFVEFTV